jgi:hypothetical protein
MTLVGRDMVIDVGCLNLCGVQDSSHSGFGQYFHRARRNAVPKEWRVREGVES